MSQHQFFKRTAVPAQVAIKQETITFPAPTRGLIISENESYMQPGAAVVLDNWKPTMKGAAVRGGCQLWAQFPEAVPIISSFWYVNGIIEKMFYATQTNVYDASTLTPVVIKAGQNNGNYTASQMSNQGGDFMIAVNDAGDLPIFFDGTTWTTLSADQIHADTTAYPDNNVEHGQNLINVCKYRNRWFFIEQNSMNAWYLGINSVAGDLNMIPLSGAATGGGKLVFCTVWSLDAGDGTDDKIVFMTDQGEIIVFTGQTPQTHPIGAKKAGSICRRRWAKTRISRSVVIC